MPLGRMQVFDVEIVTIPSGRLFMAQLESAIGLTSPAWRLIVSDELFSGAELRELSEYLTTMRDASARAVDLVQRALGAAETNDAAALPASSEPAPAPALKPVELDESADAIADYDAPTLVVLRDQLRAAGRDRADDHAWPLVAKRLGLDV